MVRSARSTSAPPQRRTAPDSAALRQDLTGPTPPQTLRPSSSKSLRDAGEATNFWRWARAFTLPETRPSPAEAPNAPEPHDVARVQDVAVLNLLPLTLPAHSPALP